MYASSGQAGGTGQLLLITSLAEMVVSDTRIIRRRVGGLPKVETNTRMVAGLG